MLQARATAMPIPMVHAWACRLKPMEMPAEISSYFRAMRLNTTSVFFLDSSAADFMAGICAKQRSRNSRDTWSWRATLFLSPKIWRKKFMIRSDLPAPRWVSGPSHASRPSISGICAHRDLSCAEDGSAGFWSTRTRNSHRSWSSIFSASVSSSRTSRRMVRTKFFFRSLATRIQDSMITVTTVARAAMVNKKARVTSKSCIIPPWQKNERI